MEQATNDSTTQTTASDAATKKALQRKELVDTSKELAKQAGLLISSVALQLVVGAASVVIGMAYLERKNNRHNAASGS